MTNQTINKLVAAALKSNTYFSTKTNGKLNKFRPELGMIAVFEDNETLATVTKAPNSCGDYVLTHTNGERQRINICTNTVTGFIKP